MPLRIRRIREIAVASRMERRLAKTIILAACIFLCSALAGPGQAAPDCKTAIGNPACPAPKTAKPAIAAKPSPTAQSNAEPRPRPEPQVVRRATSSGANRQAAAKKPRQNPVPRRTARRSAPHRAYAQTSRGYRLESRQDWKAYDDGRDRYGREDRPPSGPVYDSASGAMAGGYGCDNGCQYRDWFERYSAWYDRYGRTYSTERRGPDYSAGQSSAGFQRRDDRDQGARDRLDPWHGYNSRDGLENGY
jgi:hypothetical protein